MAKAKNIIIYNDLAVSKAYCDSRFNNDVFHDIRMFRFF